MFTTQVLYAQAGESADLTLNGTASYRVEGDRVIVGIPAIASLRNANAISGTLSVELWALKQPYQGGDFDGAALAGTRIGELPDQHSLNDCRYDLLFQEPAAGTWHLSLMLREWDGNGYVTRDFVNFDHPYVVNWTPVVLQGGLETVAEAPQATEAAPAEAVATEMAAEQPAARPAKSSKRPQPRLPVMLSTSTAHRSRTLPG
ncbi:MAG: hypothetical protein R3E93_14185 [Thiothrix sp.]